LGGKAKEKKVSQYKAEKSGGGERGGEGVILFEKFLPSGKGEGR